MADQPPTTNPDSEFISTFNKYFSPRTNSKVKCHKGHPRSSRRNKRAKKHSTKRNRNKLSSQSSSSSKSFSKSSNLHVGGGFSGDVTLSPMMIPITNEGINGFYRTFQSNMDCFINAIQILGFIDVRTADLMRMTYNSIVSGFYPEQIDCIMMYLTNRNQELRRCVSIEHWWQHITGVPGVFPGLTPGHAYIAGYLNENAPGHIILVAKATNPVEGTECNPVYPVFIIDVLGENKRISIIDDSNFRTIMNPDPGDARIFYIMYSSPIELTDEQRQAVIDAIPNLRAGVPLNFMASPPATAPASPDVDIDDDL